MRAEALKLFRKLFLNKYARAINNYFGLLCHNSTCINTKVNNEYVYVVRVSKSLHSFSKGEDFCGSSEIRPSIVS